MLIRSLLILTFCGCAELVAGGFVYAGQNDNVINREESSGQYFEINGFEVTGDSPLSAATTNALLAEYSGRPITVGDLSAAARSIENLLARQGNNFHRVVLPPQKLKDGETIVINIDALKLDEVSVNGNEYFSDKNILASMPQLKKGSTPNTRRISSAIALAKDSPAKDVHIVFVRGDDSGKINARLSVDDRDPHDLMVWANNSGSELTTRSRMGLQYSHRNVWGRDHNVSLSYSFSPEDTQELTQYGVNYAVPLYRIGSKLSAFYSSSEANTGLVADVFDVSGSGETYGMSFTKLLPKYEKYQHQFGFSVTDKLFDSDIQFGTVDIGQDIRSRPVGVFYDGNWNSGRWSLVSNVSAFWNLDGGSLNDAATYELGRTGADNKWSKVNASLNINYSVSQTLRMNARVRAQETSDRLISGEMFGMGGTLGSSGPRGFLEREAGTDTGVSGTLEVWKMYPTQGVQLGLFYDFGSGRKNDVSFGEIAKQDLESAGVGLRWRISPTLSLDADYAYVLDGVTNEDESGTQDSDSKLHLSMRYTPRIGGR